MAMDGSHQVTGSSYSSVFACPRLLTVDCHIPLHMHFAVRSSDEVRAARRAYLDFLRPNFGLLLLLSDGVVHDVLQYCSHALITASLLRANSFVLQERHANGIHIP